MKKMLLAFALIFCFSHTTNAQSTIIGSEPFSVNLPSGFNRMIGLNTSAIVQWGNEENETYGFVITENLEDLKSAQVSDKYESYLDIYVSTYSSYPQFNSFPSELYKNKKGKETLQKVISYYNEEVESTVYLQMNVFKTKNFIYQVVNFGTEDFLKNSKEQVEYIINNIDLPL